MSTVVYFVGWGDIFGPACSVSSIQGYRCWLAKDHEGDHHSPYLPGDGMWANLLTSAADEGRLYS